MMSRSSLSLPLGVRCWRSTLLLGALTVGLVAPSFAAPRRPSRSSASGIAYVDLQRAVFEVAEGRTAKSRLEEMKRVRQQALDEQQGELRRLQQSLEQQRALMSPEAFEEKKREFGQRLGELQQTYATLQRELAAEEMQVQQRILERMAAILSQIGEEQGYQVIIRKDALLWALPALEITNEVIRRYDRAHPLAADRREGNAERGRSRQRERQPERRRRRRRRPRSE